MGFGCRGDPTSRTSYLHNQSVSDSVGGADGFHVWSTCFLTWGWLVNADWFQLSSVTQEAEDEQCWTDRCEEGIKKQICWKEENICFQSALLGCNHKSIGSKQGVELWRWWRKTSWAPKLEKVHLSVVCCPLLDNHIFAVVYFCLRHKGPPELQLDGMVTTSSLRFVIYIICYFYFFLYFCHWPGHCFFFSNYLVLQ